MNRFMQVLLIIFTILLLTLVFMGLSSDVANAAKRTYKERTVILFDNDGNPMETFNGKFAVDYEDKRVVIYRENGESMPFYIGIFGITVMDEE